jgi:hypothetical protein
MVSAAITGGDVLVGASPEHLEAVMRQAAVGQGAR